MEDDTIDGSGLHILVVDDEAAMRETLALCFKGTGHEIVCASDPEEALLALDTGVVDLAFVDLRLGDESGADLLPKLLEKSPWLKAVMITAHGTIPSAVGAMRAGAVDYLEKPISPAQARAVAERVAAIRRLERRVQTLEQDLERLTSPPILESTHPGMRKALAVARQVADSDATVLLRGESGTGKGVLARAIHQWSSRSDGPFSTVNCPSLAPELLRSELFGHVKGAFTGAVRSAPGKIEITKGGTLLLDEVVDLPLSIQPRLLHFLQEKEYERVGDPKPRRADVRILAATNRDLEQAVEESEFRRDLYYRLNVISIEIPPLRERPDDILPLAESFLAFFSRKYGRPHVTFTDDARKVLVGLEWTGNVRELRNAVQRSVILARGDEIGPALLPGADDGGGVGSLPLPGGRLLSLAEMEQSYIRHVIQRTDSIEEAAETLDISPSTLWRRRRKYGI